MSNLTGVKSGEFDALYLYGKSPNKLLKIDENSEIVETDIDVNLSGYYDKTDVDNLLLTKADANYGYFTGGVAINNTYPIDCELTIEGTDPTFKIFTELASGSCNIELLKGDLTPFGSNYSTDWKITNDVNNNFRIKSGAVGNTDNSYLKLGDETIIFEKDVALETGKNLKLSTTGIVKANTFEPESTTPNLNIGNIGSTYTGSIIFNQNAQMANGSKIFRTNNINAIANTNNVYIYDVNTGSINFGNTASTNPLNINNNTILSTGKNLTLSSTGIINSNIYRTIGTADNVSLFATSQTGTISAGGALTTGAIALGNSSQTGRVYIYPNLDVGTNAVQKGITCAYYQSYDPTNLVRLFPTSTTGDIRIGEAQTSSNLNLHNSSGTGVINANADIILPSTKRIRVDRIVGTTPLTSNINIGYTDPTYTATVLLNQNTTVDSTRMFRATKISGATSTGNITIGDSISDTGSLISNRLIKANNNIEITNASSGDSKIALIRGVAGDSNTDYTIQNNYAGYFEVIKNTSGVNTTCLVLQDTMKTNLDAELLGTNTTTNSLKINNATASRLLLTDASKNVVSSSLSETDLLTKISVDALIRAELIRDDNYKNYYKPIRKIKISRTTGMILYNYCEIQCWDNLGNNVFSNPNAVSVSLTSGYTGNYLFDGSNANENYYDAGTVLFTVDFGYRYYYKDIQSIILHNTKGSFVGTNNTGITISLLTDNDVVLQSFTTASDSRSFKIKLGATETTTTNGFSSLYPISDSSTGYVPEIVNCNITNFVNKTANKLLKLDANYDLTSATVNDSDLYTKTEVYNKTETYNKTEVYTKTETLALNNLTNYYTKTYVDGLAEQSKRDGDFGFTEIPIKRIRIQQNANFINLSEIQLWATTYSIGGTKISSNILDGVNATLSMSSVYGGLSENNARDSNFNTYLHTEGTGTQYVDINLTYRWYFSTIECLVIYNRDSAPYQTFASNLASRINNANVYFYDEYNQQITFNQITTSNPHFIKYVFNPSAGDITSNTATDSTLYPIANTGSMTYNTAKHVISLTKGIFCINPAIDTVCNFNSYQNFNSYVDLKKSTATSRLNIGSTFSFGDWATKTLPSTLYTGANTNTFAIWETNAQGEGSFIAQNGETFVISNPCDYSAINFLDEDTPTVWTGFKIALNGAITASSDKRLKTDITPVVKDDILDVLSKIQIVNYRMKPPTEEKRFKNGKERRKYLEIHLGVIAQDVRESGLKEVVDRENSEGFWSVKYQDLTYYFHLGTQQLIKENNALKNKINELETKISSLEASSNTVLEERLKKLEDFLAFKFGVIM